MVQPKVGRKKTMTARRTKERRHEEEGGEMLAWRLRGRSQGTGLLAPRAAQDPTHIISSIHFHAAFRCLSHDILTETSVRATLAV
jgi:hypothetical protein